MFYEQSRPLFPCASVQWRQGRRQLRTLVVAQSRHKAGPRVIAPPTKELTVTPQTVLMHRRGNGAHCCFSSQISSHVRARSSMTSRAPWRQRWRGCESWCILPSKSTAAQPPKSAPGSLLWCRRSVLKGVQCRRPAHQIPRRTAHRPGRECRRRCCKGMGSWHPSN